MKQPIFLVFVLMTFVFLSCSKVDDTGNIKKFNFADSSETKAYLDTTHDGVYKGVLVGGTGRLKLYFNNGDSIRKAFLTLDSLSDTLICVQNFNLDEPIINASFAGRISAFTLSADVHGENALIENIFIINRVNVIGAIAHEQSNQLVYCYESTFTGSERGYFNMVTHGNKASGVALNNANDYYKGEGLLTGKIFKLPLTGILGNINTFQGGIDKNGELFAGTWVRSAVASGSFDGERTQ